MFSDAHFRDSVWNWVTSILVSPVSVIWESQGEARPAKPYVSLRIIAGPTKVGTDDYLIDPNDNKVYLAGQRELTVSVNYFGPNAVGALAELQTSAELPSVVDALAVDNVCLIGDQGIKDLSNLALENRFETRAQMDVRFRVTDTFKDMTTTNVETVEVTGGIAGVSTPTETINP